MDEKLTLKRQVTLKAIVTPRWKEEAQQQLQAQTKQIDTQIQQLEDSGKRAIAELEKQNITPPPPGIAQQINGIKAQVTQKKNELLNKKNQALQQLQQVQTVEMDQEVIQGQVDSFFTIEKGENFIKKYNVEIVLRDGVVEDIRGEL